MATRRMGEMGFGYLNSLNEEDTVASQALANLLSETLLFIDMRHVSFEF